MQLRGDEEATIISSINHNRCSKCSWIFSFSCPGILKFWLGSLYHDSWGLGCSVIYRDLMCILACSYLDIVLNLCIWGLKFFRICPLRPPVQCAFPSELFGDAIFMLEYLSSFKSLFDLDLPKDLTFGESLLWTDYKSRNYSLKHEQHRWYF